MKNLSNNHLVALVCLAITLILCLGISKYGEPTQCGDCSILTQSANAYSAGETGYTIIICPEGRYIYRHLQGDTLTLGH